MNNGDIRSWLRLSRLELAPRVFSSLIARFGSPDALLEATDAELAATGIVTERVRTKLRLPIAAGVEKDLLLLDQFKITVLPITSPDYPTLLKEIFDPPALLYVKGELLERDKLAIGVVGSRKSSAYGKAVAEKISRDMASRGLTVVSGGARGIDSTAHNGALAAEGRTIAVLGCGVDVNYPPENQQLFERIAQSGAVISEFPLGSQPEPWRFPPRNRLISGLSIGVLVCQSPESSGALITAGYAAEHGRDIYAVPGNVDDVRNRGCHKLIKEGAKLVESAADIFSELGITEYDSDKLDQPSLPMPLLTDQEKKIVSQLSLEPVTVDQLIDLTALPAHVLSGALTMLEMRGVIKRVPGHAFVRSLI